MPKGPPGPSRRHDPRGSRRRDPHARPKDDPGARSATGLARWLLPALPLVLAAIVHRRALGAFFSVDDFVRLEEAVGLLPSAPTLWRLVSEVLYVKLMLGLFGPQPLPFHIVSLALHLVNTVFVYRIGRKAGLSAGASCFASSVFGAFPIFYTVLLSAVNINDILALTLVFVALIALETPSPARMAAAVGSLVLALLSKEAVVFVPFAAVLLPLSGERLVRTARRMAPLLATGVVFAGLYLLFRKHGLGTGGHAYSMGLGINIVHNLMTYAQWSIDLVHVIPDGGAFSPAAWRVGLWPLAAFALTAVFSRSRRRMILFGCAWWLLGLLPVLPLLAHSYGHYLYVPMAGFAVATAGTIESLGAGIAWLLKRARRGLWARAPASADRSRIPSGGPGPPAAGAAVRAPVPAGGPRSRRSTRRQVAAAAAFVALAIGFAVRSESILRVRVSARLGSTQLALDPFTRKMEVARRAISTLTGQIDRARDSVVVFMPPGLGRSISASTGQEVEGPAPGVPRYDVVEAVLGGGMALRLFEPRLDSVVFVNRWSPAYRNFTLFIEGPSGQMMKMGRGPLSHSKYAGALLDGGYQVQAREYLAAVVEAFPGDRLVRLLFAAALSRTGDPDLAREHARLLIEGAPPDTITATARKLISILAAAKQGRPAP